MSHSKESPENIAQDPQNPDLLPYALYREAVYLRCRQEGYKATCPCRHTLFLYQFPLKGS